MGKFREYLNEGKTTVVLGDYGNPDYNAIDELVDYVESKYKENTDYKWTVGYGDDTPNEITLISKSIKKDKELKELLDYFND